MAGTEICRSHSDRPTDHDLTTLRYLQSSDIHTRLPESTTWREQQQEKKTSELAYRLHYETMTDEMIGPALKVHNWLGF